MKKLSLWFIALALFIIIPVCLNLQLIHGKKWPKCQKATYDYSTFAFSWIGQFCSEKQCSADWKENWDGSSFTIHGYWPSSTNLAYMSCQQKDGYDKNCYQNYTFDQSKIDDLSDDLNLIWPQVGPKKEFWKYQWDKHGTCYLRLTLDNNNPDNLSQDQIYHKYFEGAIQKFKALPLTGVTKFDFSSKQDLANLLNLGVNQFAAVCGGDNQLDEIRVCYSLAQPLKQQVIDCPDFPKECTFPIKLKPEQ